MGRLEPPPWSAVGALLSDAAILYALLFGVAVAASFTGRSSFLRRFQRQALTIAGGRLLYAIAVSMDWLMRHAFSLSILRIATSTAVCVVYVYVTYLGRIPTGLRVVQGFVGIALLVRFFFRLICAHNPIAFMIHVETFMEVLSLSSMVLASGRVWLNFSFFQASIVLSRYFEVEPHLEALMVNKTSPFRRQLARLSLEFLVFIYVFACGLQLFEVLGDPTETLTATTFELTLANSLYFTVVTIFTVGYGDFVPYTLLGRLWIIFIIVFGAYLVSRKIGQVIDVISGMRKGMGSFIKDEGVEHCVLCGNIKWEYLKNFVQEFFADDGNALTKIVVMCDQPNWTEELWNSFFSMHTQLKDNVVYLEGACMSRDDLLRAQVETALAVFILNNQHDPHPYLEDSETLKRILTVRTFAPNLPIYSMCALRDSMLQITVALEHADDSNPLAHATRAPGTTARSGSFSASAMDALDGKSAGDSMLTDWNSASLHGEGGIGLGGDGVGAGNREGTGPATSASLVLGRSGGGGMRSNYSVNFSEEDDDDDFMVVSDYDGLSDLKSDAICMQEVEMSLLAENVFCNGMSTLLSNLVLNVLPQTKATDRPWMVEYKIGAECRLAYVKLPMELHGKTFGEIAITLFDYGILLLATKRFSDVKWRTVTPATVIKLNSIGLVVTFHSAQFIDKMMMHAAEYLFLKGQGSSEESDLNSSSRDVPSVNGDEFSPDFLAAEGGVTDQDSSPMPSRRDGDAVASLPEVMRKNLGVVGSAAEGAQLNDSELRDDIARAGGEVLAGSQREGLNVLLDEGGGAGEEEFALGALPRPGSPRPRSRTALQTGHPASSTILPVSAPRVSPGTRESGDELDALADSFVEEGAGGSASDSAHVRGEAASQPASASENPIATTARSLDSAAMGVAARSTSADGRKHRIGRETAKVSFPNNPRGLPKRSHSASGRSKFDRSSPGAGDGSSRKRPGSGSSDRASGPGSSTRSIVFGDAPLPARLKGHIVVCVIGQMGVVNLKHFLDRVWMRRRGFRRDTPIVAICPKITDALEHDIAQFSSNRLYVIQGNSLSISTLKRAQFDRARAIVVLACEDKNDVDHMDSKAIFTVMTLDYMLGERSNTFVCTMIDAEESMLLLRAPAHARRRGAHLGRIGDEYSLYGRSGSRSPRSHLSTFSPAGSQSFGNGVPSRGDASPVGMSAPAAPAGQSAHVPNSPILRIPSNWILTEGSGPSVPQTATSRLGTAQRLDMAFESSGLGTSSFLDYNSFSKPIGPKSAVPPPPAYVGAVTRQWSNRASALRKIVAGEPEGEFSEEQGRLRTSRTVSFGGIGGDLLGEAMRSPGSAAPHSASFSTGNMFHSSSFGADRVPLSASFGAGSMGEFGIDRVPSQVGLPGSTVLGNGTSGTPVDGLKRSRDELFEKQRYASGEMMISSVYVALLIREFAMPGLMSVVRKIFGAGIGKNPRSKKCWVRTMKIPQVWVNSGTNGQRTYRELFAVLLELNCVPLGLYRSGEAMVRVQVQMDGADVGPTSSAAGLSGGVAEDQDPIDSSRETDPLLRDDGTAQADGPEVLSYTCPTTGHTASFEQVPGGDNVLPYVYTNPEPYTLVSEHDAVYILAHPLLKISDTFSVDRE